MIEGESSIHEWQKIFDNVILMIYVNHTSTVFFAPFDTAINRCVEPVLTIYCGISVSTVFIWVIVTINWPRCQVTHK